MGLVAAIQIALSRPASSVTQGGGNIALLKNEGRLNWSGVLGGAEYKEQRERINSLAQAAVRQAEFQWSGRSRHDYAIEQRCR